MKWWGEEKGDKRPRRWSRYKQRCRRQMLKRACLPTCPVLPNHCPRLHKVTHAVSRVDIPHSFCRGTIIPSELVLFSPYLPTCCGMETKLLQSFDERRGCKFFRSSAQIYELTLTEFHHDPSTRMGQPFTRSVSKPTTNYLQKLLNYEVTKSWQ